MSDRGGVKKKSEVIVFRKDVADGESGFIPARVKGNGTIQEIRVRFYPGQELSLKVSPFLERKGQVPEPLISYPAGGNKFLSGDDDYFIFPVVSPVNNDDFIKIWYSNENGGGFVYTVVCDIVVDYFAGEKRVIGGVINA